MKEITKKKASNRFFTPKSPTQTKGKKMKKNTKVELQFTDLVGNLKSIDVSSESYNECKTSGKGVDGSSIGMAPIEKSDLLLKPIESTFFSLPWDSTIGRVLCDIYDPAESVEDFGKETECEFSPRFVLKKVLKKGKEMGYDFMTSAEMEFFMLSNGHPLDRTGYFSPMPLDMGAPIRREIFDMLPIAGIHGLYLHHEVSTGQYEICLRHDNALKMADDIVTFRFIAKNLAFRNGLLLTFMPKPFQAINGSGMHIHMSLIDKKGENLFYGRGRISNIAKNFIAGILENAKSLAVLAAPGVNSYKRLVPGYEAPVYICWGFMNRTALIRVPAFSSKDAARVELRMPDPSCNPYLLYACVLAAGLEGIEKGMDPEEPCSINTYENGSKFEMLPSTLESGLEEIAGSKLMRDTLGKEMLDRFIKIKTCEWKDFIEENEWNPLEITKWELERYMNFM